MRLVPFIIDYLIESDSINNLEEIRTGALLDKIRKHALENHHPVDYFPKTARGFAPVLNDNLEVLREYFDITIGTDSKARKRVYSLNRKAEEGQNLSSFWDTEEEI